MEFIGLKVLGWVLPIVLGPVVYVVARELLNLTEKIDDLPAPLKRVAVMFIGTLMSAAFGALSIAMPEACAAIARDVLTPVDEALSVCARALTEKVPVQGVTAALVAMVIHKIKKSNPRT